MSPCFFGPRQMIASSSFGSMKPIDLPKAAQSRSVRKVHAKHRKSRQTLSDQHAAAKHTAKRSMRSLHLCMQTQLRTPVLSLGGRRPSACWPALCRHDREGPDVDRVLSYNAVRATSDTPKYTRTGTIDGTVKYAENYLNRSENIAFQI